MSENSAQPEMLKQFFTLPETNSKLTPENQWRLEDKSFPSGASFLLFSGANLLLVSGCVIKNLGGS